MKIKDVLQRDPGAFPLVNEGQARIVDSHNDKALKELRGELSTFVCEGQYADALQKIIRSYLDGTQTWLNTVGGSGKRYKAGSLWGSIGAWYSGRWFPPGNAGLDQYWADIKMRRAEVTWHQPFFVGK